MCRYAEVAVDSPASNTRTFTYSIPDDVPARQGHIVEVPFGPRSLIGIIFDTSDFVELDTVRPLTRLVYPDPLLSTDGLELARWLSHYYMAGLFDSAAMMMPPGSMIRSKRYVRLADPTLRIDTIGDTQRQRITKTLNKRGKIRRDTLVKSLGMWSEKVLSQMTQDGLIYETWEWLKPSVGPKYISFIELTNLVPENANISNVFHKKSPKQESLLRHLILAGGPVSLSECRHGFGQSAVSGLRNKGLLNIIQIREERDPLESKIFDSDIPPILNHDQEIAVDNICQAIASNSPEVFLLQGITGSGKTEVYLRALDRAIALGQHAIVMVPELALTPQTIERFASRFPDDVAILHSGLSLGQRFDQWWGIKEGKYKIVIGSRGSIFSPQPNLGLIIIDEEHEWTYKQKDTAPRYDAREVAIKIGDLTGSVAVLGSATPDVVSKSRAISGQYKLLTLQNRVSRGVVGNQTLELTLPQVEIVDLRDELKQGNRSIFSSVLQSNIGNKIASGEQIILYINRRGSGGQIQCRDCGNVLRCNRCHMSMNYHAVSNAAVCHICNYTIKHPSICKECNSHRIRYLGLGTQRVVQELEELFPGVKTLRWDRDAASYKDAHAEIMNTFSTGHAQILVGTQMIAKGLHFPKVTLVGVLCADIGLFLPDFRAGERVFELLCQVSGRTGRSDLGGKVIIQTYSPTNYAVHSAAVQDYDMFYSQEIVYRYELGLPPFGKLIRLMYSHKSEDACAQQAIYLGKRFRQQLEVMGITDVSVLGPAPAFPSKVRGRYRWHIILKGIEPRRLMDETNLPVGWMVEIDPTSVT